MILDAFCEELEKNTATQIIETPGEVINGVQQPPTKTTSLVGNCLIWVGSMAEHYIAASLRDKVDAIAIFWPDAIFADLAEHLTIVSEITTGMVTRKFNIIGRPDNIANDDECLMVNLKEVT